MSGPPAYGVADRGHNNTVADATIKKRQWVGRSCCFRGAGEIKRCVRVGGETRCQELMSCHEEQGDRNYLVSKQSALVKLVGAITSFRGPNGLIRSVWCSLLRMFHQSLVTSHHVSSEQCSYIGEVEHRRK